MGDFDHKNMRVCIVGAGAIGGLLAVKIAQVEGSDVSVIARGAHLRAIRENGLTLEEESGTNTVQVTASEKMEDIGPVDIIFLCVKAHQIADTLPSLPSLYHKDTVVITTQNGIPWWYFQRASHIDAISADLHDKPIQAVDPGGVLLQGIDPARLIGCVVYPAAYISGPGVIKHVEGNRFPIGELDGSESERCQKISHLLIDAGFKAPILPDVRSELWLKCWGSCCFNPLSALTHSTLKQICTFPLTRELATRVMTEAQMIAEKLGSSFRVPLERRLNGAAAVGDHKTSMLQDVEEGKSPEIEALVGAVVELGTLTHTETPCLSTLYACVSLLTNTLSENNLRVAASPLE